MCIRDRGTSVFIMTFTALTGAVSHFAIGGAPDPGVLLFCVLSTLLWARIAAKFANRAAPAVLNRATGVVPVSYTHLDVYKKQVRLLACSAAVALRQDHVQKQVDFRYNKTKEDVLLPVLNLLLGNPPDFRPRQAHPPTEALERLREDSFAMYLSLIHI